MNNLPDEIVNKIMLYYSTPTADIIRSLRTRGYPALPWRLCEKIEYSAPWGHMVTNRNYIRTYFES